MASHSHGLVTDHHLQGVTPIFKTYSLLRYNTQYHNNRITVLLKKPLCPQNFCLFAIQPCDTAAGLRKSSELQNAV